MVREVKGGPFVGEVTVVLFLEGGRLVEVVLMLMVSLEEVAVVVVLFGGKGLPRAGVSSGHNFFAAPSPLSFLLFKLVLVSISSWLTAFFFFNFFVAVGDTEVTDDAGVFKVAGVSISFGEVAVAFVGAFVGTFVGVDSGVTDGSVVVAAGNKVLVCF